MEDNESVAIRTSKSLKYKNVIFFIIILILIFFSVKDYITEIKTNKELVTFIVYVKLNATDMEIRNLNNQLSSIPEIEELTYVSKEEALEQMKKSLGNNLLDGETNIFPAYFVIKCKNEDSDKIIEIALRNSIVKNII